MITPAQARSEFTAAESAKNLAKEAALEKFASNAAEREADAVCVPVPSSV
jgi:hypothetical protein